MNSRLTFYIIIINKILFYKYFFYTHFNNYILNLITINSNNIKEGK